MKCKTCGCDMPCKNSECDCADCKTNESAVKLLQTLIFEMSSVPMMQVQKSDRGYVITNPDDGRTLADEVMVKKMGKDRRTWFRFMKELGVDHVILKGLGRRGTDNELSSRQFLDKISPRQQAPKQGNVIPVIKGTPE